MERDPLGNPIRRSETYTDCPYPCAMTLPHDHSLIPRNVLRVRGVCPYCLNDLGEFVNADEQTLEFVCVGRRHHLHRETRMRVVLTRQ